MLRNMFKIAWRNAIRQKQFTLLNILGLSIGTTACLLIALYVQDQMSYDKFHEKGDRIYRVNQPMIWGEWSEQFGSTGPNVAVALREDIPEFEAVTRVHTEGAFVLNYKADGQDIKSFKETRGFLADDNFFEIFTYRFLEGTASTALTEPGSIVITKPTAEKYFGNKPAVGELLEARLGQDLIPLKVTAVVAEPTENSHIDFDMLISMTTNPSVEQRKWTWIWTTFVTYGLVQEGTDIEALEAKIQDIPPKWAATTTQRVFNQTYDEYISDGREWTLYLQPLEEVYLHSPPSGNRLGAAGNILYVRLFIAIGIMTLLLSGINFMNLSTAKSANRAKEVGIRKVLGSEKSGLVKQFIFESVLFSAISTVIAMVGAEFSLGAFNTIANTELSLYAQLGNPTFSITILSFILFLGFLAGSYPAFYLSSFKPVHVLKGKLSTGFKGKGVRNVLVVFQFTISIGLIIGTFFVQKQLNFTANYDLGYDKDNLLQLQNLELLGNSSETLQTLLEKNPAISQAGISDAIPPNVSNEDKYKAYGPDNDAITLNRLMTDEKYLDLLDLEFITGRNFEKERGTDKYAAILNESAVKELGWGTPDTYAEDSPLGKYVTFPWDQNIKFEVIGVVKDFNFNSLRLDITPLLMLHIDNDQVWNSGTRFASMRLNPALVANGKALQQLLGEIRSELEQLDAAVPFEYSFMDKQFEASFMTEQRIGKVLNIFTIMALTIACLGLFGLAAFTAEQRTKELGVRKVLGAKARDLVVLFSSEFTKMVILSMLLASPLAYYLVEEWLSAFAYKTPIEIWVFVVAGTGALLISWLTIGFQSLKAAYRNPVDSLRDE